MTNFVNINGDHLGIAWLASQTKKKPATTAAASESKHIGWRVIGHPPGACAKAHADNVAEWRLWNAHDGSVRAHALANGHRSPDMWDETLWRLRTKKRNVNNRPYGIPDAATQCAELARKAGWEDVEVIELKKGSQE